MEEKMMLVVHELIFDFNIDSPPNPHFFLISSLHL